MSSVCLISVFYFAVRACRFKGKMYVRTKSFSKFLGDKKNHKDTYHPPLGYTFEKKIREDKVILVFKEHWLSFNQLFFQQEKIF
jgi:hypothetical protein